MAVSYNAVSVTSAVTNILPANNGRRGFLISNNGSVIIYIAFDSSVTSSTGIQILPQDRFTLTGDDATWKGAIWGITASGSSDIRYWDWTK